MAETFFNKHQRATIEAAMARIIPTDDMPGAREANCIEFVDRYLSGIGFIYAKPDGSGFEELSGRAADAWTRRIETMRARYVEGIRDLDARAREHGGTDFVALTPDQQDHILREIETGPADATGETSGDPSPALQQTSTEVDLAFLPLLIAHTRQGFYADPIYGGNKDQMGWKTIGFPGPASLKEVHVGRYTTLQYFAEGEAEKVKEFHDGL